MSLNYFGYYSLVLSFVISIVIIFLSIKDLNNSKKKINTQIIITSSLQLFLILLSFICLIILFIKSEFSNELVFNNSHTTKPLFYKISGVWGNHEGSLLLWLLILSSFKLIFSVKSINKPKNYLILTIFIQEILIMGFLIFVLRTSNPFNILIPSPVEGLGLNPILQDPALAIHPPILYLGYVGTSIIFSSSLAALLSNFISKEWAKNIKGWILFSWASLTLGIMIGSIWAYYELGWGGFWFWDPVENISLLPWLSLTALLHCVLVLEKRNELILWTIVLAITSFILSLSGTFLVRSGILNSIHTFASDPDRGIFILTFLFILAIFALTVLFLKLPKIENSTLKLNILSKEFFIMINNLFMVYFLSVVLIGTIYPIFLEVLSNEKISIGPPFYNKLLIPFLIPFLLFMGIATSLKWINSNLFLHKTKLFFNFIFAFILTFFIFLLFGIKNLLISILIISSIYLLLTTIRDFFSNTIKLSQKFSHFGFSLLILSIIFNSILSKEINKNLRVGETMMTENETVEFNSVSSIKEKNYIKVLGNFEIKNSDNIVTILKPELRIYNQPNIITSEADIKISLFEDKFLVMNYISGDDYFNVRYQKKPLMLWIWISAIFISLGGILSLIKKKYDKKY